MSQSQDYFSVKETFKFTLPDKVSTISHQKLNEGQRRTYEDKTSSSVELDQSTQKASVEIKPGVARFELLRLAIINWELQTANKEGKLEPVAFNSEQLDRFLNSADPDVIDIIEEEVKSKNKWVALAQYQDVKSIDREIERLNKLKAEKAKEEKK